MPAIAHPQQKFTFDTYASLYATDKTDDPVLDTFKLVDSCLFLKQCSIGHLKKTRLLLDLKPLQNVLKHSLFKLCKFHEKTNGQFLARGQNVLYNA